MLLAAAAAAAQTPAPSPVIHAGSLNYSYSLPSDWEVLDSRPMAPVVKQEQSQTAASEAEKKGIECVQLVLTARHGDPASVVVMVELPYTCFGQTMSEKDLPGFAEGAAEGLKKSFDVSDATYGAYTLGTHGFWIERAKGAVIGHPEATYTVEVACSLLKQGAVCWMTMAKDAATLQVFEQGAVMLDGETAPALVPASAFEKKAAQ